MSDTFASSSLSFLLLRKNKRLLQSFEFIGKIIFIDIAIIII